MKEREVALRLARGLAAEKLGRQALVGGRFSLRRAGGAAVRRGRVAVVKLAELGDKSPLSAPIGCRARARLGRRRSRWRSSTPSFRSSSVGGACRTPGRVLLRCAVMAIFNARGDYRAAEKLFEKASQLGTEDAAKELYLRRASRGRALKTTRAPSRAIAS